MHPAAIGPFRIERELGRGGMGEVFLARDTRLDRKVAIKALPAHLAQDPDRLARFQREAKVLASLNHPGIGAIYGLEETGGHQYLILEYVEGETLADRLAKGPIPVEECLPIARQIAEALEVAHEKGVIHRDLKPGNVMVTDAGVVKVLDFGLARTADGVPSASNAASPPDSPTATSPARFAHSPTIPGAIMGTAGYMSPEQARGKPVDKRSDIFSFGCILHEMLTGAMLFQGETVADSIGATLHMDPDLSRLPAQTPAAVRRLLRRCLVKDRNHRLHDIADARIELQSIGAEPEPLQATSAATRWAVIVAVFVGVAVLVGLVASTWSRPAQSTRVPLTRFAITETKMPSDAFLGVALSPDGRRVVYRAVSADGFEDLKTRRLDALQAEPLSKDSDGGWLPFFSPDGGRVGFFTRGAIKHVTLASGITRNIVMIDQGGYSGATWMPDDTIIFAGSSDRFGRVPASGGPIENLEVKGLREGEYVISPWALPDGRAILCGVGGGKEFDIGVYHLADRTLRRIAENGFSPTYAASGHILYQLGRDGPLMAAPFDVKRLVISGPAFPVLSDLGARAGYQVRTFAVAADGTLAYVPRSSAVELGVLMWVDRQGKSESITEIDRFVDIPRISNSGRSVAFRIPAPNCEVGVHDTQRGVTTRLTHEGDNHGLAWSSDDTHVLFARLTAPQLWGVMATSADGTGRIVELSPTGIPRGFVSSVSPDGKYVLLNSTSANGEDVYLASVAERKVGVLLDSRFRERAAVFSRDGRYVAYVSDESGREEVYVQPFPEMDTRERISTNGGADPVWSVDGKELFFRSGQKLMAVAVTLEPRFSADRPQLLFEANFTARGNSGLAGYDVHPDGQRFVMVGHRTGVDGANVNIVLNWFEELKRLSPERSK
ncbi:MAG: protein kinase [Phycisphaerae bacterium]|nr:protein kinase [Phycisphaerae bacterium]